MYTIIWSKGENKKNRGEKMKKAYIYQPLLVECDKCGKTNEIIVPYKFDTSTSKEDVYIKQRLEREPVTCGCNGTYDKVMEEYKKMDFNYIIKY